jgi:type VI secretion system secreted protein VgrG
MADFNLYFPIEINLEGAAYEDVPGDSGGCTKYGLTLDDVKEYHVDINHDGSFDCKDVATIDRPLAGSILKALYWDYFKADQIPDQVLASYIVDSGLNQGRILIVKYLQSILGIEMDGHFGPKTLSTLIEHITMDSGKDEYDALHQKRLDRYNAIVASRPTQIKFLKGWMNRLNAIKYN